MGKPTGFLEYNRETAKVLPPKVRIANFKEFRTPLNKEKQKLQGARCMACGVPFCQAGMMIGGMASGCPLHNLVPETNDLVFTGNWKQAFLRLNKTHSFPEFTSRVCPALCEAACTCNLNGEPVSTKENERAIIETAYAEGWVVPQPPKVRTGKTIAVIGSGPSGLAAAQQLNRRGHNVLYRAGQPWNVSVIAQACAEAAAKQNGWREQTARRIAEERAYLMDGLRSCGVRVYPGEANFLLFHSSDEKLDEKLRKQGIMIRNCSNYRGLGPGFYRTAVKTRDASEKLLHALRQIQEI